jgi:hypothetical protein
MMFRTYHHRDGIVHAEFTVSIGGPVPYGKPPPLGTSRTLLCLPDIAKWA